MTSTVLFRPTGMARGALCRADMPNPSLGLGVWGPLQPANDCLWCRNLCIGLQVGAGILLMARPGYNPWRGKWANRAVRFFGIVGGSYLILMGGLEGSRYFLRSDPWYSDAVHARQKKPATSVYELWFGPKGYKAVSIDEFLRRAGNKTTRSPTLQSPKQVEKMVMALRATNRKTVASVLQEMKDNKFKPPLGEAQQELVILGDDFDEEDLEFEDVNHWARIEEILPLNMVVLPASGENSEGIEKEDLEKDATP